MADDMACTDAGDGVEGGAEPATGKDVTDESAQVPRVPTNVTGPTAAEIELHNATHLPYRHGAAGGAS